MSEEYKNIMNGDWNKAERSFLRGTIRKFFTKEEVAEFIRSKNIRTMVQFRFIRRTTDPNMDDVVRVYGSWSLCTFEIWGPRKRKIPEKWVRRHFVFPSNNPYDKRKYCIKVLTQNFGNDESLWTEPNYIKYQKLHSEEIPPIHHIRHLFRKWSYYKYCARAECFAATIDLYVQLKDKLGHYPTKIECQKNGIETDHPDCAYVKMMKHFGTRYLLNQYLENLYAK